MDEREFRILADRAMDDLYRRLVTASDKHAFETDFNAGTLALEFDSPPAKFVVSPNSPVRQIWVSALSRSFKLDWDAARNAFTLPSGGQTLVELLADAAGKHLGEEVSL
jgi:iron donor protein CyaY